MLASTKCYAVMKKIVAGERSFSKLATCGTSKSKKKRAFARFF
jgi:hypothetical protein